MKYLIGIDVGTQALRTVLFSEAGDKILELSEGYPTHHVAPGRVEQEPERWWRALVNSLRRIAEHPGLELNHIAALSYACSSCTVVALDERSRPLRPALLWMDERALQEAEEITRSNSPVLKYSGGRVSPQWMLPKTLWLLRHERDIFDHAFRIVEQTDFLTYRLTGQWTLSYNNLVAKWNYANPEGGWPEGFLDSVGLAQAIPKWPVHILPVGSRVGQLDPEVAKETGLPETILVVQGGIDSHAGMVGMSVVRDGEIAIVMGTSTVVMGQSERPVFADIWGPYPDAVIKGAFTLGGGQTSTGSIIQWLVANLAGALADDLPRVLGRLEQEAASLPPGSDGLVALDHFQGNRTPLKDSKSRGAIWGLTLWHSMAHLFRAFLEANAFGTRHILDNLKDHGYGIKRVFAGGGGARSGLAVSILADVCGIDIQLVREGESTALGAAIWAGLGAGVFPNYVSAVQKMVKLGEVVHAHNECKSLYDFYYDKYLRTYRKLSGLMHEVVDFESTLKSKEAE
jgi:FGGY-family pentulose kinase